jgi:hypothetical protein
VAQGEGPEFKPQYCKKKKKKKRQFRKKRIEPKQRIVVSREFNKLSPSESK